MPQIAVSNPIGGAQNVMRSSRFDYDFAVDGGAIGTLTLRGGAIPANAVIRGGYIEVVTPPTSAASTATIGAGIEGAADLQAAIVISGAPWSTVGRKAIVPVFTIATSIKTTQSRSVAIAIAVQVLTAGKFSIYLDWSN